jgi:hypothetical protein
MKRPPRAALILRNGALLAFVVATCNHLSVPEGVFLALGVLTVLESDLGGGVIAGRERFTGTLMGLVAVVISSGALKGAPQAIQVFVGLTLARMFGFAAGLTSGYIVGGQVVAGSLLHHSSNWWYYAFWRTVTTLLGVMLGILISRHIYSDRAISQWQEKCNSWLIQLAQALNNLNISPDGPQVFKNLRKLRNELRQGLPELAAEESVLDAHANKTLLWAQHVLQHGSTVMSCCRDLAPLLNCSPKSPFISEEIMDSLISCGCTRLKELTTGNESSQNLEALHEIHGLLQAGVRRYLNDGPSEKHLKAGMENQSRTDLLMASRLILLVDSLINAPHPVPNQRGQMHVADKV